MYLVAIVLPPAAVLLCGKPVQAVINVALTAFFCVPGIIHACMVVGASKADGRTNKLVKAMNRKP